MLTKWDIFKEKIKKVPFSGWGYEGDPNNGEQVIEFLTAYFRKLFFRGHRKALIRLNCVPSENRRFYVCCGCATYVCLSERFCFLSWFLRFFTDQQTRLIRFSIYVETV